MFLNIQYAVLKSYSRFLTARQRYAFDVSCKLYLIHANVTNITFIYRRRSSYLFDPIEIKKYAIVGVFSIKTIVPGIDLSKSTIHTLSYYPNSQYASIII